MTSWEILHVMYDLYGSSDCSREVFKSHGAIHRLPVSIWSLTSCPQNLVVLRFITIGSWKWSKYMFVIQSHSELVYSLVKVQVLFFLLGYKNKAYRQPSDIWIGSIESYACLATESSIYEIQMKPIRDQVHQPTTSLFEQIDELITPPACDFDNALYLCQLNDGTEYQSLQTAVKQRQAFYYFERSME